MVPARTAAAAARTAARVVRAAARRMPGGARYPHAGCPDDEARRRLLHLAEAARRREHDGGACQGVRARAEPQRRPGVLSGGWWGAIPAAALLRAGPGGHRGRREAAGG